MKLNKDLIDAVMMLSFIILVLVGTTEFDNITTKNITMGALGGITVLMVILRVIESRISPKEEAE